MVFAFFGNSDFHPDSAARVAVINTPSVILSNAKDLAVEVFGY